MPYLVVALLLAAAQPARAADDACAGSAGCVMVFRIEGGPEVPAALPQAAAGAVATAVARVVAGPVETLAAARMRVEAAETRAEVRECDAFSCLQELGNALGVPFYVQGDLNRIDERHWVLNLAVNDMRSMQPVSRDTLAVEGGPAEVVAALTPERLRPLLAQVSGLRLRPPSGRPAGMSSRRAKTPVSPAEPAAPPPSVEPVAPVPVPEAAPAASEPPVTPPVASPLLLRPPVRFLGFDPGAYRMLGWLTAGSGALLVAAGVYANVKAESMAPGETSTSSSGRTMTRTDYFQAAVVLYALGGTFVAVGSTFLVLDAINARAQAVPRPPVAVLPAWLPHGGGLSVSGRF